MINKYTCKSANQEKRSSAARICLCFVGSSAARAGSKLIVQARQKKMSSNVSWSHFDVGALFKGEEIYLVRGTTRQRQALLVKIELSQGTFASLIPWSDSQGATKSFGFCRSSHLDSRHLSHLGHAEGIWA